MEASTPVAARVDRSPAPATGLWATVEQRVATPSATETDLWADLQRQLDFGHFVPVPAPDVEARELRTRDGGVYHVLRSPTLRYLRLDRDDFALWSRMDGRQTVQEIAIGHFLERGDFAASRLTRLVHELRAGGFLGPPPVDVSSAIATRAGRDKLTARLPRLLGKLLELEILRFDQADRVFGAVYRSVGWLAYTRPAKLLWVVSIVLGLGIWGQLFWHANFTLLQTNGSYTLGLLTLALLDVLGINFHVLAQGLSIKRHGRRINRAGLVLSYGFPMIYLETSDTWLAERHQRIAVSWSGPCATLVLGSLLAIAVLLLGGSAIGAFLFKAATICLANAFFNLLPILNLDGYFMLVDYLEMPALRANANAFVRRELLAKLRRRERLTREELIFTLFGLGSALLFLLIPLVILEARDLRHADMLRDLWSSPQRGAELIAIGMTLALLGPAVFPILQLLGESSRGLAGSARRRWRRWRGQVPREQVVALAALPFLQGVPRVDLLTVARHLAPMRAAAGTILVRQGAAGDRFYLIQAGSVRVSKLTSDGRSVQLAKLGPGDYFGETALLAHVSRTASVVADSDVRLLTLDAGHFRRWLGERLELANAVRQSLAERERLISLPLFRGTGPADLDRLAARLLVTRYSAGDVIIRQGEPGDRFFLVIDGRVEVVREEAGQWRRLAELVVGDYFGEMALLCDEPRSATVRALTPVETYTLNAADFRALLERLPLASTIRRTAHTRADEIRELSEHPPPGAA